MCARENVNRRSVLLGAAASGAAVAAGVAGPQAHAERRAGARHGTPGATVRPDDPRYSELITGNNQRFVARPDYIRLVNSPEDAEAAMREAVRTGKRITIRGGGHCFADFVCNPDTEIILDVSEMTRVYYDPRMRAFAVEAGARLLNVYEALYKGWNVTLPAGICYSVGIGGHIAGGGYGLLSRAHGLTVDHLYAVEVVVVDERGRTRTVVATREKSDPHRDLWWGHTGGGGGNFGLVTRYWFRSPGAEGHAPQDQLISPPARVLVSAVEFPWQELDRSSFHRLLKNFGDWHERHSAPDSPYTALSSLFNVNSAAHGALSMFTQVDATVPNARGLLDDYLAAITEGVRVTPRTAQRPMGEIGPMPGFAAPRELPWLQATRLVGTNNPTITDPTSRGAHKSAYMRRNFSDHQLDVLYRSMTDPEFTNPDTMLVLFSFGGQVNAVADDATANAQRSSVFKMCFQTFWGDAADDSFYLTWIRDLYENFFAATGGVPTIDGDSDGCYINYPDNDVADPRHNRSGVPWSRLYYKDNYPRLQRVKRRWDPADRFRHALSIRPADR